MPLLGVQGEAYEEPAGWTVLLSPPMAWVSCVCPHRERSCAIGVGGQCLCCPRPLCTPGCLDALELSVHLLTSDSGPFPFHPDSTSHPSVCPSLSAPCLQPGTTLSLHLLSHTWLKQAAWASVGISVAEVTLPHHWSTLPSAWPRRLQPWLSPGAPCPVQPGAGIQVVPVQLLP